MIEGIQIFHVRKNQGRQADLAIKAANQVLQAGPVTDLPLLSLPENFCRQSVLSFETCLRKMWFVKAGHKDTEVLENLQTLEQNYQVQVFRGTRAYQFILEIICGLDSPVVGETEVFGQFKEQIIKKTSSNHCLFKWANHLVGDAKEIRREHLINLGSQTYGSYCRRLVNGMKSVDVIGLGQFAQSLLPWLEKKKIEGKIFTRCPENYYETNKENEKLEKKIQTRFNILALKDMKKHQTNLADTALVICAPIRAQDYDLSAYGLIIDLRETSHKDIIENKNTISLKKIFEEIEKGADFALEQKNIALNEIYKRSQELNNKIILRPFGWDDICA